MALRLLASGGAMALLAACGPVAPPASSAPPSTVQPSTAGTPAPASGGPKTGGTLNFTLADLGTENNDVILAATNNVTPLIYEPLLRYDPQGNILPWLAESFSMSPDGKLWTFNLRKGVKWTNGDDFTSDDVSFSIQRYISDDAKSAWSPLQRQTVDHIETPDPNTVLVYAKDPPYVFYPDALTGLWIIPKNYFEKVGLDTFSKQPIGTGPWVLNTFTSGASAEIQANTGYWGTAHRLGQTDVVTNARRVDQDCDAQARRGRRRQCLQRQRRHVARPQWFPAPADQGIHYSRSFPVGLLAAAWPDLRRTRALGHGSRDQSPGDRGFLFQRLRQTSGGKYQLTELHWGFDPIWYSITYDPAQAQQLLQDAGYPGQFANR